MKSGSSVKRNVLASWGTHAFNMVIGFYLTRYTLDVLGVSTYGNWLFVNSIASYANLLYCGFGETVSRYVSRHQADNDQKKMNEVVSLVSLVFRGLGAAAFLFSCGLAATAGWWGGWEGDMLLQVRITCLILGLNIAISMSGAPYGGVLIGFRRFDIERAVGFIFDVVRLVLFLVMLHDEWGLVTMAFIYFLVTVGENVSYVFFAYRLAPKLEVSWKLVNREVFKETYSFSAMSFVNTVASQVINATDTIVIGFLLNKEAIVPYYFGMRLAQFCRQPIDKIAHICLPTAGAMHSEADRSKRLRFLLRTLSFVILLISALFIGAWYFGGDVLNLWVGPKLTPAEHLQSHRILMVMLAAHLIALPCSIFRAFLFGLGEVRVPAMIYIVEAFMNFSLSIILCQLYGIEGVAWGTAVPIALIELGVLMPYAVKTMGLTWSRLLNEAVWPAMLPLCALWAYAAIVSGQSWSHGNWIALFGVAVAGAAVLGGAMLAAKYQERMALRTAESPSA